MVTINRYDFTNYQQRNWGAGAGIAVRYNRRWWLVRTEVSGKYILLIDLLSKTATMLTTTTLNGGHPKIIDYSLQGTKLKLYIFGCIYGQDVRAVEIVIDMSSLTIDSETVIWSKTSSDDPDIATNEVTKGTVLSRNTILHITTNKPYVFYLDARTGDIIYKFDTGLDGYNPRLDASKAVVRPDDIYMIMGRHLAGDNYRIFKVYSKTVTIVSNSNPGGDSPHVQPGSPAILYRKILLPVSGCTVASSSPPIIWFDDKLNLVGTTDLRSVTGFSYPHPFGWHVIGVDDQGRIIMLAGIADQDWARWTQTKIMVLAIDPNNFSATSLFSQSYNQGIQIDKPWYSDAIRVPLVDRDKKKIYLFAGVYTTPGNDTQVPTLFEIDISDLNIVDWNKYAFYTDGKTPTVLTLSIQSI